MANNNKHISPGLYTRIEDLSQATASIGTTTLGLVGETLRGAAFEPIKIGNKNDFLRRFGAQSPIKKGSNIQYELAYVANAFLDESNELYVTRVLGLGGYEALKPYVLITTDENGEKVIVGIIRSATPVTINAGATSSVTIVTIDSKDYEVNFLEKDKKNIKNIITNVVNDKFYLESYFQGDLEGIELITIDSDSTSDKTASFKVEYQTPVTPVILSDLDTNVSPMFRLISISDGESANYEIKISFENIDTTTREFDILVRDFNDIDKTPTILEAFRRCSMNPLLSSYIGKRIGTYDGTYTLKSNFISVEVFDECPVTAVPSGIQSMEMVNYANTYAMPVSYKLEQIADSTPRELRRNYLGWDFAYTSVDVLKYHGKTSLPKGKIKGFHLEDIEGHPLENDLHHPTDVFLKTNANILANRFTIPLMGGFDGWDIFKKKDYFKLSTDDDYKAFLKGAKTMMNRDEVPMNIFATPGINYYDNANLVGEILDMIEEDRGDSLYVINSPDYVDSIYDDSDSYALDLVDMLDISGLDSMFGATYGSHLLHNDTQNGVNVWLPPTFEVLRDMAEVDKRRAPWFAVAGMKSGKLKSSRAKYKVNNTASDILYKGRINPIKTYNGLPYIFGNKTLLVEDTALNRVNVVRCVMQVQKLVEAVAITLLFEPNDKELQSRFKSLIEPILDDVKKQRGLVEAKIIVDDSNNTDADRDQLQLNGYILLKVTNATEYINITYGVTNQGANFSLMNK